MKSASGERPPDEADGPGEKQSDRSNAARPGEVEKRRCTGHAALTVLVETALIFAPRTSPRF